jgi:HlyD family secretion protein
MRRLSIVMTVGALAAVLLLSSCGSKTSSAAKPQTGTVQRGNIVVSTTSTGNLAFTQSENVAFEMTGTVEQVLVSAGDSVKKDQVLATLDTSVWQDQIKTKQKAVTTAQRALATAERNISAQQLAVSQKQLDLQSAQNVVADIPDVKAVQDRVDMANAALSAAQGSAALNPDASSQIVVIRQQLNQANSDLRAILAGTGFNLSTDMTLQIEKAQLGVIQAQRALDDASVAVDNAVQARDDAKQTLADAQSSLDDALAISTDAKAPFDGFVTTVSVEGGQDVNKGAIAAQVADPNKFEVSVLVGERDITSMAVGGLATVSVNSMTGVSLPATITAIAPTATVQSGVVNYQVTVEIQSAPSGVRSSSGNLSGSLSAPAGAPSGALSGNAPTGDFFQGTPPTGLNGQMPILPANAAGGFGGANMQGAQGLQSGAAAQSQTFTLRQGLSVTVNLVTASKSNVLMVPNRAITRSQGKSYVNIQKGTTTEQVAVTTGIANSQFTEVTDGVTEGETVLIPITTSTSSSSQPQGPGGGLFGVIR